MLEDIATLTGGKAITEDLGLKLENIKIEDLGKAKKITIDKDNTTIVEGSGGNKAIEGRVKQIRAQIEDTTSDYDREKLQERLEARRRRGGDQGGRRDGNRNEGKEGARRRRDARDEGGRGRRHRPRRRRGADSREQGDRQADARRRS